MSLKIKLMSMISAFVLVLSMLLVGVLAATQTINLKGTVSFNITNNTLYIKDIRIQTELGLVEQMDDFMPGFVGGELDIDLGTIHSSSGTVNVYFDFVNTTSTAYQAKATGGNGVTLSTSGTIAGSETPIENVTTAAISGTIILTIQFTGSSSVDLNGISISFSEYTAPYERVDAEGNPDPEGNYLLFGYYPQTIKASNVTIDTNSTDSRGYYLGSDGEYYAALSANPYNTSYTFSDGTTITSGTTYYFKVEPLLWRILTEDYNGQGTALVVSDKIIDAMAYQSNYTSSNGYYYVTGYEGEIYANNYEYSEVRAFLTGEFYNTAFTEAQKSIIQLTTVDNSLDSTLNYGGQYVCEDTKDYVFLLSMAEAHNTDYGYQELKVTDPYKAITTSDYSRANYAYTYTSGTYTGTGWAWLRSPYDNSFGVGNDACYVTDGSWRSDTVNPDNRGVVPALQIRL